VSAPPATGSVELAIEDVAYRGKGIARRDGCVVFVPGTLPGEIVRAAIVRRQRNFAEARLTEVVRAAPARVQPACPLVPVCPGCCYQHAAYAEEIRLKQAQLRNLLERIGGVRSAELSPPVASPAHLGYRNKIVLHADAPSGRPILGYAAEDNVTVVDVPQCPLAVPELNAALRGLRADAAFMARLRPHARVTLRWTPTDGVQRALGRISGRPPWLTETTALGPILVPPGSFFQVNPAAGDALILRVRDLIRVIAPESVIDLYCGAVVFALIAAEGGARDVLGVDRDAAAIAAARANAAERGPRGIRFDAALAEQGLSAALRSARIETLTVIADPPRAGLDKGVVRQLAATRPANLVYVSCAADTLARDAKLLAAAGFSVVRSQLVDMFPRTPYFESITWFQHAGCS